MNLRLSYRAKGWRTPGTTYTRSWNTVRSIGLPRSRTRCTLLPWQCNSAQKLYLCGVCLWFYDENGRLNVTGFGCPSVDAESSNCCSLSRVPTRLDAFVVYMNKTLTRHIFDNIVLFPSYTACAFVPPHTSTPVYLRS